MAVSCAALQQLTAAALSDAASHVGCRMCGYTCSLYSRLQSPDMLEHVRSLL